MAVDAKGDAEGTHAERGSEERSRSGASMGKEGTAPTAGAVPVPTGSAEVHVSLASLLGSIGAVCPNVAAA